MTPGPEARGGRGVAARRAALAAVRVVEEDGAWSTTAVPDAVAGLDEARDRALASRLAYDTIRWEGTLDWALGFASARPPSDIEPSLRRIVRMGALQLLRLRMPARAVVDTAVSLAHEAVPRSRAKGAAGFVNGVLRGLSRRLEAGDLPWPDATTTAGLVVLTAHPAWVVEDAITRFGIEGARAVLDADNESPGLTLRANVPVDELLEELAAEGIEATRHPAVATAVRAPGADPRRLACVTEGRAVPQDAASLLVAEALAPGSGATVLDLCAGPGGKATHLAAMVAGGRVTAVELHPHRARLVEQAAARQHLDVEVVVGDATAAPVGERRFDAVLVDAPCTGLGVGRRRPEVRWRRSAQDAADLADLQARLLLSGVRHLAPGGRLTYAVCTWTTAETTGVLARPEVVAALGDLGEPTVRQLRPDLDDSDGMFIATWGPTA